MYPPGFRETECPKEYPNCLLNTEAWVWPTMLTLGQTYPMRKDKYGTYRECLNVQNEQTTPFLKLYEYIMPRGECFPGFGFYNILECVDGKDGVINWKRFDAADDKCR